MLIRAHLRIAVLLAAVLAPGEARAAPLRVLVLVRGEQDRDLAARIAGQTADLDAVVSASAGPLPPTLEGQLAVARAAAGRADAVVWFGVDGEDWLAYVAQGERVLVRRIGGVAGAMSRSASLEAVALAVRTAVRGLAAGGEIGVDEAHGRGATARGWAEIGWSGVLDGEAARGRHGVAVRFGGAHGRWRVGAGLELQPAVALGSTPASIQLERQEGDLLVGAELARATTGRWALGVELRLGVVRFNRVTTATDAPFAPTASRSAYSPVLGPAVHGAWRLGGGSFVMLALGVDLVTRPPEYGVAGATGFVRVAALRPVEPRATLALGFASP